MAFYSITFLLNSLIIDIRFFICHTQCPVCKREFISGEYLQGHITRRHPNHLVTTSIPAAPPILVESAPPLPERAEPPRVDQEEMKSQIMEQLNERLLQSEVQIKQSLNGKVDGALKTFVR